MTPHPRKRFGQHFLVDKSTIRNIVHTLSPKPDEILVEIGAGTGALTLEVLSNIPHLFIIEIDRDLSDYLTRTYPKEITLYNQDVLKFNFSQIPRSNNQKLRIFGNLPYNISTPLLFHLLHDAALIEDMLFMLQKEVVMRICAEPHTEEYGRLSVMIQYACQVQSMFDIDPTHFSPPPKVMSSVVYLKPYAENQPHPVAKNYQHFADLVNIAFQHRRKTLRNALRDHVNLEVFASLNIEPMRRPETLSVAEYVALSNEIIRSH